MTNSRIKLIVISAVTIFVVASCLLLFFAIQNSRQTSNQDSTTQPTAPPYEGRAIVAFDDQTNNELYRAVGGDDYVSIKYFLGAYLANKGIAKDPIPKVVVTNFKTDMEYLGKIGSYKNIYSFDVYSSDLNTTLNVVISDITNDENPTNITITNTDYTKRLQDYRYDRD